MNYLAVFLALVLPATVHASDQRFLCHGSTAKADEIETQLIKYADQDRGKIITPDLEVDVDVLHGLDSLNFLYIGEGLVFSYNINLGDGTYDFSASGSTFGNGKGTCIASEE